ncbi:MAG: DUF29 domain-containing protein [Acidobacteriia bacterium]|nr:DUF29 domain-containing protein [Terriglobia bacterium]
MEKTLANLYEEDFSVWACRNAQLLREGRIAEADLEHIAEEMEDLGKEREHSLASQVRRLLAHLLKYQHQPSHRSRSWLGFIANARAEIEWVLEHSPSLKSSMHVMLESEYPRAIRQVSAETGIPRESFPPECPYTFQQIMQDDFLPE